tara:strand:- start:406 stop:591 length:186 start_codon:yes stop_codon:yes gene_type:complete
MARKRERCEGLNKGVLHDMLVSKPEWPAWRDTQQLFRKMRESGAKGAAYGLGLAASKKLGR